MTFIDDLPGGSLLKPYHVDHDSFYKKEHEVDWITGAAFLIPKSVVKRVGMLDEEIFMYGEDVDWCYRIKKAGFKIIYSPSTKLVHIGRGSTGQVSQNAILREYVGLKYIYRKHKPKWSLQLLRALLKIGALARVAIFGILGRKETAKFYGQSFKVA
jgi:GT2 family glycosyltransferase